MVVVGLGMKSRAILCRRSREFALPFIFILDFLGSRGFLLALSTFDVTGGPLSDGSEANEASKTGKLIPQIGGVCTLRSNTK
jgi:hypothetical protein